MSSTQHTMRAWVLKVPGGPEAFELGHVPRPDPRSDELLIRVRAFGLNRSEHFTRRGDSPTVKLPRILGIECVGEVVHDATGRLPPGHKVAAMMGGMGRDFDGSYAEYCCVPHGSAFALTTDLPWPTLGALPEMLQTTHGSLHQGLELTSGQTLLIRGGTSSIGLMAATLARGLGATVLSTTRDPAKREVLLAAGAADVLVDNGKLEDAVKGRYPRGVDKVLELIGTTTLIDSLQCAKPGGVVCMTGILGGGWELAEFRPMSQIPTAVRLTAYSGGASDISPEDLQRYVTQVESGELAVPLGPSFEFDQLRDAHYALDANQSNGKIVVVVTNT